jgi:D-alanine-D-alanine ligase
MNVGITFDLKPKTPIPVGQPDDLHEEFDSPITIKAIADVIRKMGHNPIELGNGREFLEKVLSEKIDFVFNIAEGSGVSRNREARVPAVCEMLNIPCTGSDVLTLALCLDKDLSKRIVQEAEVVVPNGILLTFPTDQYDGDYAEFPGLVEELGLKLPLIAKPVCEGSSKGIRSKCLIKTIEEVGPTVISLWHDYKQGILLEEFIAGDEVTIGIVGNDPPRILGTMGVMPKVPTEHFVYSLEVKRDWEPVIYYDFPAKLPPAVMTALEDAALTAYGVLGIKDIARIDFRIRDGIPYFIEANPLPGLNPEWSDLILTIKAFGMTHEELIIEIMESAMARYGMK